MDLRIYDMISDQKVIDHFGTFEARAGLAAVGGAGGVAIVAANGNRRMEEGTRTDLIAHC